MEMKLAQNVEDFIAAAPTDVQSKLNEVRAAIREVAPDIIESISYGMPFYSYRGETGINARLCYFALLKRSIGLYLRPPVIEDHKEELASYKTTKSAIQLPLDEPVPISLIKELVRDGIRNHNAGEDNLHAKVRKSRTSQAKYPTR